MPVDGGSRLDPQVIAMRRLVGWILALVLAAALSIAALVTWVANGLGLMGGTAVMGAAAAAAATAAWALHSWPAVSYRHTSYRVDDRALEIRRGVFWRKVITVPRSRVQHTDVSQGPLERAYGLGTLIVYTAGTEHAKVPLAGLSHPTALTLREHLLTGAHADGV
jgi:hypothetical protein